MGSFHSHVITMVPLCHCLIRPRGKPTILLSVTCQASQAPYDPPTKLPGLRIQRHYYSSEVVPDLPVLL